MAADGSIIINTKLDSSGINKGMGSMGKQVQQAAVKLKEMNAAVKEQEQNVRRLQKALQEQMAEYEYLRQAGATRSRLIEFDASNITPAAAAMEEATVKLARMKTEVSKLGNEYKRLVASKKRVDDATKRTASTFESFGKRIGALARRVFFYSIVLKGLRAVLDYFKKVSQTSSELMTAFSRLRGALLTAFQPIWETILPYLVTFVNILTKVILAVATFFSWLTGKSASQSAKNAENLNKQADAISKTGKAADNAKKSLAAFDEINNISAPEVSGGESSASTPAPSFNFDMAQLEEVESIMEQIGIYVLGIALGLLAWKIASMFGASLLTCLGIFLAIFGIVLLIAGAIDAWKNGIDWKNLQQMLLGILLLVAGLGIAFGVTGAAVGAIIGGVALLVLGIREWIKTGELSTEAMYAIVAGLLLIGVAIALLTGSWIPLVIAAVAAIVVIIIKYWDEIKAFFVRIWGDISDWFKKLGEKIKAWLKEVGQWFSDLWNNIKAVWGKVKDWFKTSLIDPIVKLFTDFKTAVVNIWNGIMNGIKSVINNIISFVESMVNGIINGINWLIEKINSIPSIKLPDWGILGQYAGMELGFSIPKIKTVSIPRLAQGSVVPANREFLAMLGDNKHETEIVSPLSTMKEALKEALQEAGGEQTIILQLDGEVVWKYVIRRSAQAAKRTGRNPILGV